MKKREFKEITRKSLVIILLFSIIISMGFISAATQKYSVKVTEEHPFLLESGEYIPASELEEGMELKTIDGKKARLTSVKDVVSNKVFDVYNLDTEYYDNFILPGGVVVHNSNAISDIERVRNGEFKDYELERIRKSERDLGLAEGSLSLQQMSELMEAHYTGNNLEGYLMVSQKARVMKSFSAEQRRILFCNKDVGFNSGPLRTLSVHDNTGKFIETLVAGDISSRRNIRAIMKGDLSRTTPFGPGWKGAKVIVDGKTGRMWWWKGDELDSHHLGMTARAYAEQHPNVNPDIKWSEIPEQEVYRYFGFELQMSPEGLFSARRDAFIEQWRTLNDNPTSVTEFERAIRSIQEQIDNANRITQCYNPMSSIVDRNMKKYPIIYWIQ